MANLKKAQIDLPDQMPESWVSQLKEATRPAFWTIILGSSVIAGIISGCFSVYTVSVTNRVNRDLKILEGKLQVQTRMETLKAEDVRAAYGALRKSSQDLKNDLSGLKVMVQIAVSRRDPDDSRKLHEQLRLLGVRVSALLKTLDNPSIDDQNLKDICKPFVGSLSVLLSQLENARADQVLSALDSQYKSLESDIDKIIDTTDQNLRK